MTGGGQGNCGGYRKVATLVLVKEIHSFLKHGGFYKRLHKRFLKGSKTNV